MDFQIITVLILPLFFFLPFATLLLKIFTGKSLRNSSYPPVLGTVFNQLFYFNRLYDYQTEVAIKHPTFRILCPGQSEIYTTDPSNIEHILKTNFGKYSKGKYNQDIISDLFGQGIFAVDGQKWQQQRKLASFEFSTRVLRDFSCNSFRKNAAKLVRNVSQFSQAGQYFDIQDLLMRCSLDSIFKVGFGVDLDCLEGSSNKEAIKFMKAFDDSNEITYWRYVDPFWPIKRYLNIGCEAALNRNIKIIHNFVDELIKTKRQQLEVQQYKNDKEDILSRFLVESRKDPEKMTDQYLRDIILNFMLAGKDSTGNTLSWFFYLLSKNPSIEAKIVEEVTAVIGEDECSIDEFMDSITDEKLDKMHYLHATLTETLRLYPAVPMDGRCADGDDILPDGFKVKKGDGVYYMSYAMGRMPYIWGDDAQDFRPERWLQDGVFQPQSPFKFIAFHIYIYIDIYAAPSCIIHIYNFWGDNVKLVLSILQAGPRICLGKQFAYRQMKIVATSLLSYFHLELADEMKNVTYRTMFTLHINGGLHISATPRKVLEKDLK